MDQPPQEPIPLFEKPCFQIRFKYYPEPQIGDNLLAVASPYRFSLGILRIQECYSSRESIWLCLAAYFVTYLGLGLIM